MMKAPNEYCPKCRKRTYHIKAMGVKMCSICGTQAKQINALGIIR